MSNNQKPTQQAVRPVGQAGWHQNSADKPSLTSRPPSSGPTPKK